MEAHDLNKARSADEGLICTDDYLATYIPLNVGHTDTNCNYTIYINCCQPIMIGYYDIFMNTYILWTRLEVFNVSRLKYEMIIIGLVSYTKSEVLELTNFYR